MITIDVRGIPGVRRFIETKSQEIVILANDAVKKAGFFLQGEVQESIAGRRAETKSVDTGRFLNSVKTTNPSLMVAKIESNVSYAEFLEYGTSRMAPRSHFRNSAKRNEVKIREFIVRELARL